MSLDSCLIVHPVKQSRLCWPKDTTGKNLCGGGVSSRDRTMVKGGAVKWEEQSIDFGPECDIMLLSLTIAVQRLSESH